LAVFGKGFYTGDTSFLLLVNDGYTTNCYDNTPE